MTQEYVSVKIVTGWPQKREQDGTDGYGVKYSDGYTSWSPAPAFEEASVALGNISHYPDYLKRLVAEAALNRNRLDKLRTFLASSKFHEIITDPDERNDLNIQESLMARYHEVLARRIKRSKVPTPPPVESAAQEAPSLFSRKEGLQSVEELPLTGGNTATLGDFGASEGKSGGDAGSSLSGDSGGSSSSD